MIERNTVSDTTHADERPFVSSSIIAVTTGLLYPFIIVFGFYVIANGHNLPGGGFQGGAILATLFIGRFIVHPVNDIDAHMLHNLEQMLFVLILILPVLFLFLQVTRAYPFLNGPYLILMNLLIGFKVCLGLTIVVFRFGFDEDLL